MHGPPVGTNAASELSKSALKKFNSHLGERFFGSRVKSQQQFLEFKTMPGHGRRFYAVLYMF